MTKKPYQNTRDLGALISAIGFIAFFASLLAGLGTKEFAIMVNGIVGSIFMILMGSIAGVVVDMARDIRRMAGEPAIEEPPPPPPPPPPPTPEPKPSKPKPKPTVIVEGKVICGHCRESFRVRPGSASMGQTFTCPMCGEKSLVE